MVRIRPEDWSLNILNQLVPLTHPNFHYCKNLTNKFYLFIYLWHSLFAYVKLCSFYMQKLKSHKAIKPKKKKKKLIPFLASSLSRAILAQAWPKSFIRATQADSSSVHLKLGPNFFGTINELRLVRVNW